MPAISQLDVVNEMLAALGESPVNSVDEDHPLIAAGLRMIRVANLREQAKSWWFNKEFVTLTPDIISGNIFTPEDAIRVDPTNASLNYVQRGRRLYQAYAPSSSDPYKFSDPVAVWLVRLLPFEDLPASAALLVSYAAQVDFSKAYDADTAKVQQIMLEYRSAYSILNAEHIRNVNANLLNSPGIAANLNRIGPSWGAGRLQHRM